jgi:D-glycero-D-manno-heptose 1,7-bisphosphate phosphatase
MKLVILDRDGTINADSDDFVKTADEWLPLPGSLEAIAKLNHAGWHVVVVSNQSGLGRGLFDVASLNAMHAKMHKLLAAHGGRIDAVFYCPHSPEEACTCRKPLPGLFEQVGERYGIDLKGDADCVGDSLRDVQAGAAGGLRASPGADRQGRSSTAACRCLPTFPPGTPWCTTSLAAFADAPARQPRAVLEDRLI